MSPPRLFIDAHVHVMTPPRIKGGIKWIRKAVPAYEMLDTETTSEELMGHIKQAGAQYIFNYFYPLGSGESREINRWQRRLADSHPGIIPFASLHPEDKDREGIIKESLEDLDLAGFKFHPYIQGFDILDRAMRPVFAALEKKGYPVTIHTGFSIFYGRPSMSQSFPELLRRYPGMKTVAAHMLFTDFPIEGWGELMERYPHLYLDTTNVLSLIPPGSAEEAALRALLKKYSQRMVFGSDYPMGMDFPVENLYRLINRFCPGQEILEDLCWKTAAGLSGGRVEMPG